MDFDKMAILGDIDKVKQCADAETVVELSVERYEELLQREQMLLLGAMQ
jgi:hypothetical protein